MDDYDNIDPYTSLYTLNQDKDWLDRTLRRVDRLVNTLQRMQRAPTIHTPRPQWPITPPALPRLMFPNPPEPPPQPMPYMFLGITPDMLLTPREYVPVTPGYTPMYAMDDAHREFIIGACRSILPHGYDLEHRSISPDDQVRHRISKNKPKNRGL